MGKSWIIGSDFPTFILFLMIVGTVVIALLRWIDINKKIKKGEKKWTIIQCSSIIGAW